MKSILNLVFASLLIFSTARIFPQDNFHDCGMSGMTDDVLLKEVNKKKNRYNIPASSDINDDITFSSFLQTGDDHERFDEKDAVEITAWVKDVKWGSKETCNCHHSGQNLQDVHIELVLTKNTTSKRKLIVAEITPRLREEIFEQLGISLSNSMLKRVIKKKKVKIKGWLLFDTEHITDAVNTDPEDLYYRNNTRATVWEIHPVTSLEIIN